MPALDLASYRLYYETTGTTGEPIVLVHGSCVDHREWDLVRRPLAERCRVTVYDRRGYSQSTSPSRSTNAGEHAKDLESIVTVVGHGTAHIVANSSGAAIAIRFALLRPDLVRSLNIHDPALTGLVADDFTAAESLRQYRAALQEAVECVRRRDSAGAAGTYVERVAGYSGGWTSIAPELRQAMIANVGPWMYELADPTSQNLELTQLRRLRQPVLLTTGSASPPVFAPILEKLAGSFWTVGRHSYDGAGSFPHLTHPDEFASMVRRVLEAVPAE